VCFSLKVFRQNSLTECLLLLSVCLLEASTSRSRPLNRPNYISKRVKGTNHLINILKYKGFLSRPIFKKSVPRGNSVSTGARYELGYRGLGHAVA
jgi:hypothetical protein